MLCLAFAQGFHFINLHFLFDEEHIFIFHAQDSFVMLLVLSSGQCNK